MTDERKALLKQSLDRRFGGMVADAKKGGHGPGPGGRNRGKGMDGGKPKDTKKTVARLFSYVVSQKRRIFFIFLFEFLASGALLACSYMLRPIINTYIFPLDGSGGNIPGLAKAVLVMLTLYLLCIFFSYYENKLLNFLAQDSLVRIRRDLFEHISKLPVSYYDHNAHGDIMSRFTNDVDNIGQMLSSTLLSLVSGVLQLVGTFCLMVYTSIPLTLVSVVIVPLMLFAVMNIAKASSKYFRLQQSSLGAMNGYIEETITGAKVVKVFNHEETAIEEFEILNEELKTNQLKAQFFGGVMGPVMNASNQVIYTCTAVVGALLCILKGFDIGGMTVFVNYTRQFSRPISQFSQTVTSLMSALAGAERVFAAMDEDPESEIKDTDYVPAPMKGDILFEHVYFSYDGEKMILKDINLYAHPGQKIAFVGSTGAGKTTVTNLLNRFYDIKDGSITIDGVDIRNYNRDELRRNIAVVLQDTHLFTGTIMENIRYGRPDATDEEVIAAAKTASAHSFIRRLPKGYNTVIEQDGANLSQGQRQLLNIARAAISKAPVLVLDEATSSVDTKTEKQIEKGLHALMSNRTTLIIAHRLSTVRNSNAIMVLEQGEIIERGTHDDLLAQKGRYYELYTGKAELE